MKRNFLVKLLLCILLACVTAFSFTACGNDESGENNQNGSQAGNNANVSANVVIDGLEYSISNGGATIKGVENSQTVSSVVIPATITYDGSSFPVNKVNSGAFSNCSLLTSITVDGANANFKSIDGNLYTKNGNTLIQYAIGKDATEFTVPDGVTSIETYAFIECDLITTVNIPDTIISLGYGAFYDCDLISSVTLPEGLLTIGERAFFGCNSLETINIPNSVESIGYFAFEDCENLKYNVKDGDNLMYLGNDTNNYLYLADTVSTDVESVAIDENCKFIGYRAFYHCSIMLTLEIPASVVTIGDSAFTGCTMLSNIDIPNSVGNIGASAFLNCTSLESVTFSDSVASLGDYAFRGCTSLTSLIINDTINNIGFGAFYDCLALTTYCEATNKPSGWNASWNLTKCPVVWDCNNNDVADDGSIYTVTDGLRYSIKDGIATVVRQASILESANIPESITYKEQAYNVTSVAPVAFKGCSLLTSVQIAENVTSVGTEAFSACESLKNIVIPNSLTSMGTDAFAGCKALAYNEKGGLNYLGNESNNYLFLAGVKEKDMTDVVIDENCKLIGYTAFKNYISLVNLSIPDGVIQIGAEAFNGCVIETISMPTLAIAHVPQKSFKSVVITSGESIAENAFKDCKTLVSVEIPEGIATIGNSAFVGCVNLTELNIPNGVEKIGSGVFSGCVALTIYCKISAQPADWDANWNNAKCPVVWDCDNNDVADDGSIYTVIDGLRYSIKEGVATVVRQASKTSKANIPTSITYKEQAYNVTSIADNSFSGCVSLKTISIANGIEKIGANAFFGCSALTTLAIAESVTEIGASAFAGCEKLVEINIPNGVEKIGASAFSGCSALTTLTIAESVTEIGAKAFAGCTALERITFNGTVEAWKALNYTAWANIKAENVVCSDGNVAIGE